MNVLIWLRRDLRVHDHPALIAASRSGPVLPLFVADADEWSAPARSGRQWAFLAETLAFSREGFAGAGAPLVVRSGDAAAILAHIVQRHRIERIFASLAPSQRLREAAGVPWEIVPEGGAHAPPELAAVLGVEPGLIPPARALRLADDLCPHRQPGGDPEPLLSAAGAMAGKAAHPRDAVAGLERRASRLSAHLACGAVSATEAAAWPGLGRGLALSTTARQAAPTIRLIDGEPLSLAWQRGETGLPFADACLRYLSATGWLPSPLRAMVASVGLHLLGAGQAQTATALARLSTDFDPALLAFGLAAAARRPVDPVALGQRLDPEGRFVRRWLPELAEVPDTCLHRPWRWQGAPRLLGHRYPEPLADPATALRAARQGAARQGTERGRKSTDTAACPAGGAVAARRKPRSATAVAPGQLAFAFAGTDGHGAGTDGHHSPY